MNQDYLFKHWLATLVFAPFLTSAYTNILKIPNELIVDLLDIYPAALLFSIFFSLPTFLVYFLIFRLLIKHDMTPGATKVILIALTVLGISMTILTLVGSLSATLIFGYSMTSIISGCFFKIK